MSNNNVFSLTLAVRRSQSPEGFSVNFGDAWKKAGYPSNTNALEFVFENLVFGSDYVLKITKVHPMLKLFFSGYSDDIIYASANAQFEEKARLSVDKSIRDKVRDATENEIRDILQEFLGGETEVRNKSGAADLVTKDRVIELKLSFSESAIAQVKRYARHFPKHKPAIFIPYYCSKAESLCSQNGVELLYPKAIRLKHNLKVRVVQSWAKELLSTLEFLAREFEIHLSPEGFDKLRLHSPDLEKSRAFAAFMAEPVS